MLHTKAKGQPEFVSGFIPMLAIFVSSRDAKFPGILRWVNFHREFWEFCGNIGNFREYSETLGIFK